MRDIDFKVISEAENSTEFQKTRFWKEKSVENVVTLEDFPFNSSTISFHIWLFKKSIHASQNNVHMLSFLFCMGFTLGPMAQATLVYLRRKVVCLFCFVCTYEMHRTRMLQLMFSVSLESSQWGGVHGLGSMMFGLVVQKFLNIEWFLHWKLN